MESYVIDVATLEDPLEFWVRSLNTKNTKDLYGVALENFAGFVGMSPKEMLELRQQDLVSQSLTRRKRFEVLLKEYEAHLRQQYERREGSGYSLRSVRWAAIKHFFSFYGLELHLRRGDTPKGSYDKETSPLSKAEIKRMLAISDLTEQTLIIFGKDSGMSCVDASRLRLGQVGRELNRSDGWRSWLDEKDWPISVRGRRVKTGEPYHTFIGPEAIQALRLYFEYRERGTQYRDGKRSRGLQPETLTLKTHVFRCKSVLKPMDEKNLAVTIRRKIRDARIRRPPQMRVGAHSLRHTFQKALEDPELKINPVWIRIMMGHKKAQGWGKMEPRPGTYGVYSHPEDFELRKAYSEAYDKNIRVYHTEVDEERFQTLEGEVEDQRRLRERSDERILLLERMINGC